MIQESVNERKLINFYSILYNNTDKKRKKKKFYMIEKLTDNLQDVYLYEISDY